MIRLSTRYAAIPVVHVSGRIVGDDASILKSTLLELVDSGYEQVAVEMGEARGIDNNGIGALLAARGRLTEIGGGLTLVSCSPQLIEDLKDTGMMDLFPCRDRLEEIESPH